MFFFSFRCIAGQRDRAGISDLLSTSSPAYIKCPDTGSTISRSNRELYCQDIQHAMKWVKFLHQINMHVGHCNKDEEP
jgi:hypothetical protein